MRAKFHAKAQRRKVYCHYLDCWYELRTVILNNIDPKIISSVYNLRVISRDDNLKKGSNSEMLLESLIEMYKEKV